MQSHASWTFLLFLVLVSSFVVTGCSTTAVSKGPDPLFVNMYCPTSDDGQSVICEPHERLAHFNSWVKEALYKPGSTFSIWTVGPDRSGSRRVFSACIPEQWARPVWKAKGDFITVAREGASGSRTTLSVPAGCHPPGPTAPGSTKLVVSPDASTLASDVWQSVSSGSAPAQLHSAIVCDRSDSTQGTVCTPGALLRVFDSWVQEGLLLPGASLSVEMVGPLLRDALRPFYQLRVPNLPVGERVSFVLGARSELAQLFSASTEKYASTIAEAISASVRRLREHRGAYRLYALSDLLQISAGVWNFETALPPPNDFIAWLRKTNLAPDLRDIPVLVCGLPTGHFGQNSQAHATRLHDLWQRVFQSLGAPEVKVFNSCDAAFAAP